MTLYINKTSEITLVICLMICILLLSALPPISIDFSNLLFYFKLSILICLAAPPLWIIKYIVKLLNFRF